MQLDRSFVPNGLRGGDRLQLPWDEWIWNLARLARPLGITPSGEGPDRSGKASDFVRLVLRIQSELPDDLVHHEPEPGSYSHSSQATFARAIRRALQKRPVKRRRYRPIELKNLDISTRDGDGVQSGNLLEPPADSGCVSKETLRAFADFKQGRIIQDPESAIYLEKLVELANANGVLMHGMEPETVLSFLKTTIANNPIVYGVWPDPEATYGVGTHLIKGKDLLRSIAESGLERQVTIAAVRCFSYEMAVATNIAFGDGVGELPPRNAPATNRTGRQAPRV
jgi:hypothetical protein